MARGVGDQADSLCAPSRQQSPRQRRQQPAEREDGQQRADLALRQSKFLQIEQEDLAEDGPDTEYRAAEGVEHDAQRQGTDLLRLAHRGWSDRIRPVRATPGPSARPRVPVLGPTRRGRGPTMQRPPAGVDVLVRARLVGQPETVGLAHPAAPHPPPTGSSRPESVDNAR